MSGFSIAQACIQRVDHGEDRPLALDQAVEQVSHPLAGLKREELVEVCACLACQVVGYSHGQNADAKLAMTQILTVARDYERRVR